MKWFRVWVDILDDHKIAQLNDYEFRIFVFLMACASEEDAVNGRLTRTLPAINRRCRRRNDHFNRAVETFQRLGLITISCDGFITITNWDKRQFKSDVSTERVKKHRQQQPIRNVSETVNETPPDSDSDTDTDKKKKRKTPSPKKLTDEEWLESLKSNPAYANLDIIKIKGKCEAWCQNKRKAFTRARFLNWLNREDVPIGGGVARTQQQKRMLRPSDVPDADAEAAQILARSGEGVKI